MDNLATASISLLHDRISEWKERIANIRSASKFIYTSTYFIQWDQYGKEYLCELEKAHSKGVRIYLIIDWFGQKVSSNLMSSSEKQELNLALARIHALNGFNIIWFKPNSILKKLLGSGMHIKIQVNDIGDSIFSSSNISITSFEKWNELSFMVRGGIIKCFFIELSMMGCANALNDFELIQSELVQGGDIDVRYLSYDPTMDTHLLNPIIMKNDNPITNTITRKISLAKKSIDITSFYFKPHKLIQNALADAAERGVRIKIHHSHRLALGASEMPWISSYNVYKKMLHPNVTIYEHPNGEHSKILLVDCEYALAGSYNFEFAAHDRLSEAMIETTNRQFIDGIIVFLKNLENSEKAVVVDRNYLRGIPINTKIKSVITRPLRRWI